MSFTKPVSRRVWMALAFCVGAGPAVAQNIAQAPAEAPPAQYTASQYVDSAGCAFIRAGIGDVVKWVPRVTRDRRQVCGLTPTYSVRPATTVQATPPVDEPKAAAPKARVAKPPKTVQAPKAVKTAPAQRTSRVGVVVTPETAAAKGVSMQARVLPRHVYEQRREMRPLKAPKTFKPAWDDDRLNPRRAEQTLQGHVQMRKVWTNTLPRRLVD